MNQTEALIVCNAIPGLGNSRIRQLIEATGSPQAVLALKSKSSLSISVPEALLRQIEEFPKEKFLTEELARAQKLNVNILGYTDSSYPELLQPIPDAPVVLYVKGELPPMVAPIAIVGSRNASMYGITMARQFGAQLAEYGFTVISGLARGIDTAAHQGTLSAMGKTVAILGCGLDHMYPAENAKLAEDIAQHGAVISEFPLTMPPLPHNFPRRNRIISGMSLGVIVVEAALKSGALITADFALEQGREVYAIPGKIDYAGSAGVNRLIKQGAKLVTSVADIIEDIKPDIAHFAEVLFSEERTVTTHNRQLSEKEQCVFDILNKLPKHFDAIVEESHQGAAVTNAVLSTLELKKVITQLPGKFFTVSLRGTK